MTAVRKVPVMNLLYPVCQTRLSLWTRSLKMHTVLNITISTTGTVLSAPRSLNTSLSPPFLSSRLAFSLLLPSSAQKRQSVGLFLLPGHAETRRVGTGPRNYNMWSGL